MSDARAPVLLQVCSNDHPPFADICRYYAAAAARLSWETATVMLESRAAARDPAFHYPATGFAECARGALDGREPVFALCHRYRAYRAVLTSGVVRGPVVAVAHEFGFFRRRRRRWQRRWDRLLGRAPAVFAGVSDAVRDELTRAAGDAILLPNGIDLARADARRLSRERALEALGLTGASFNVGVVGRLHPKKNPELAVAGFASVAAQMPEARLVFVGSGELADQVRRSTGGLPVTLTGFVPEAASLMAAFDVLLMASGAREAFGMVALEAMAAGVPVVCGPAAGPRFVVGETGRPFRSESPDDIGAALLATFGDWRTGALSAVARNARERVEREFSVSAAAGRLEALAVI